MVAIAVLPPGFGPVAGLAIAVAVAVSITIPRAGLIGLLTISVVPGAGLALAISAIPALLGRLRNRRCLGSRWLTAVPITAFVTLIAAAIATITAVLPLCLGLRSGLRGRSRANLFLRLLLLLRSLPGTPAAAIILTFGTGLPPTFFAASAPTAAPAVFGIGLGHAGQCQGGYGQRHHSQTARLLVHLDGHCRFSIQSARPTPATMEEWLRESRCRQGEWFSQVCVQVYGA